MGHARLVEHYDAKYAAEAEGKPPRPVVAPAERPDDRFQACLKHFPPRFPGGDILEVAAGDGVVARSLAAAGVPFRSYTATDFSPARLEGLVAGLGDPRMRAAELDAEALASWQGGPFDAVIMMAIVEHLVDPIGALRGVRGLLRPGGLLYIDTPNAARWTRRAKLLLGRFPSTASRDEGLETYEGAPTDLLDEGHLHYFTHRMLSRVLMERCGFARVEVLPYVYGGSRWGGLPDRLARAWPALFSECALAAWA